MFVKCVAQVFSERYTQVSGDTDDTGYGYSTEMESHNQRICIQMVMRSSAGFVTALAFSLFIAQLTRRGECDRREAL
jgi:hypothetical protein